MKADVSIRGTLSCTPREMAGLSTSFRSAHIGEKLAQAETDRWMGPGMFLPEDISLPRKLVIRRTAPQDRKAKAV